MSEQTAPAGQLGFRWFAWNLPISFGATLVATTAFMLLVDGRSLFDERFPTAIPILYVYVGGPLAAVPVWLIGSLAIALSRIAGLQKPVLLRVAAATAPLPLILLVSDHLEMALWCAMMIITFGLLARLPRLENVRDQ